MNQSSWVRGAALVSVLVTGAGTAWADNVNPLADAVHAANDRFSDVAVALKEGYNPIPCDSSPMGGGMGIHYVNPDLIKGGVLDITKPQAVMYEPMPDGKLALIAVEYIALKGPAALQGHMMNYNAAPNSYGLPEFYEMHVWAWKKNPLGTFADDNPDVSCDAMKAAN